MFMGRPLNDSEIGQIIEELWAENDRVRGLSPAKYAITNPLPYFEGKPAKNDYAIKAVSDAGLARILEGNFQVGTAEYFRGLEGQIAQDPHEGTGTIFLEDLAGECFCATVTAAFNYYVFCATGSDTPQSRERLALFGPRLVRINRLHEFADKMSQTVGGVPAVVHDVLYSNYRLYKHRDERVTAMRDAFKGLDGKFEKQPNLKTFNAFIEQHGEWLEEQGAMPLLFTKREPFADEREVRIAIRIGEDIKNGYLRFNAPELVDHIEVLK